MAQFKRMTHFNQEAQKEMLDLEETLQSHGIEPEQLKPTQDQRDTIVAKGTYAGKKLGEVVDYYGGLRRRYYAGGYMGAKRKELVKKVGYDAKNAAHLIRLLRMGIEFLHDGQMQVARSDAQELLAIKRGEWSLDQVRQEAERLFKEAETACVASRLPERPDMAAAEKLCIQIIQEYHAEHV